MRNPITNALHHTSVLWTPSEQILTLFSLQLVTLKISVDNLEKERDFYFNKLRDVEILCQNNPSCPVDDILKILYATDEDGAMDAGNWEGKQQE